MRSKYASVWNVDQVLSMFKKDGDSTSLSLQDLMIKTAMLLALTRPCRGADLAELDLRNRSYVCTGRSSLSAVSSIQAVTPIPS